MSVSGGVSRQGVREPPPGWGLCGARLEGGELQWVCLRAISPAKPCLVWDHLAAYPKPPVPQCIPHTPAPAYCITRGKTHNKYWHPHTKYPFCRFYTEINSIEAERASLREIWVVLTLRERWMGAKSSPQPWWRHRHRIKRLRWLIGQINGNWYGLLARTTPQKAGIVL